MVQILETFQEFYPAMKLVGKRYTDADRDANGSFAGQWGSWFQNDWFSALQEGRLEKISDDCIGLMCNAPEGFEYWIGLFLAPDAPVPEGFAAVDIPAMGVGVCLLYGKDGTADLFGMDAHTACVKAWEGKGWKLTGCFFERYNCPRYTTPDEKGNVILDYCAFLAK